MKIRTRNFLIATVAAAGIISGGYRLQKELKKQDMLEQVVNANCEIIGTYALDSMTSAYSHCTKNDSSFDVIDIADPAVGLISFYDLNSDGKVDFEIRGLTNPEIVTREEDKAEYENTIDQSFEFIKGIIIKRYSTKKEKNEESI